MSIEQLNGIGPKMAKILNKINIFTVSDLLKYYPYRYNYIYIKDLNDSVDNETIYVKGVISTIPKSIFIRKNLNYLMFSVIVNNQNVNVKIFNRNFLKKALTLNKEIVLVGKYNKLKNSFMASDIKFNMEENTIEPIYHLTDGLSNSALIKLINSALDTNSYTSDLIPDYLNEKYNFISKEEAVKLIHQPNCAKDVKSAKLKLIYEELFEYTFKINILKNNNKKQLGIKHGFMEEQINDFLSSLPFKLTEDQLLSINEILNDLKSNNRMNRLVLGDVGSGKTIVAVVAILANYYSGFQSTFMAPTEILAKQHFESVSNYLNYLGMNIAILTGSTKKVEKNKIYELVKNGEIDLLIGTHSLINNDLIFKNLGLVVTDEQHLFGVNQRNALQNKGAQLQPDVLYLSATPIPRTYALTIYGDLDLSIIKSKPKMRKEIITCLKKEKDIKDVLFKIFEEIKLGHQIFVVSPLIEQNDNLDLNSVYLLEEKLNTAFNNKIKISTIHGKMKQKEKDVIMNFFAQGDINILISTTVIEVGIDIPNATMMVIFNAERFGLAALHQLRGRVGRNALQSYCYLISDSDSERLKVMEESNDGFYISEKDFEQRGQGDLFGIKQSGEVLFKIADLKNDSKILFQASKDSEEFINSKKYLGNIYYENLLEEILFLD